MHTGKEIPAKRSNASQARFESRTGGAKSVLSYHNAAENVAPKMRNKALSLTAGSVPYIKELRPLAGSIAACIVMQQLDFWFARHPGGFYKFMEPAENHEAYRTGDSWCEELGVTPDEFRTAFDKIATRYISRTAFEAARTAGDVFAGKFYCSYFDKRRGLTYYLRNHDAVDAALDRVFGTGGDVAPPSQTAPAPVAGEIHLQGSNGDDGASGDGGNHFGSWQNPSTETETVPATEMAESSPRAGAMQVIYKDAKTTSETTHRSTAQTTTPAHAASATAAPVKTERVVAVDENKNESVDAVKSAIAESMGIVLDRQAIPEQEVMLESRLVAVGVKPHVARRYATDHTEESARQLDYLPHRTATDQAAILVKSINEAWDAPFGYLDAQKAKAKRDQDRRDRAAEEACAATEVAKVQRERAERLASAEVASVAKAQREAEQTAALASLSTDQRTRLESVAWQEMARMRGPISSWAVRVLSGQVGEEDALKHRMVRLEFDRVLMHLVADATAKGGAR